MGNGTSTHYNTLIHDDQLQTDPPKKFRKGRITFKNFMFQQIRFSDCGGYLQLFFQCREDSRLLHNHEHFECNVSDVSCSMHMYMFTSRFKMDTIKGNSIDVNGVMKYLRNIVDFDCIMMSKNAFVVVWMTKIDIN